MKYFDVIVIGSGAGMNIVERALSQGLRVALVDKGPLSGTCLNLGCIPSKMLITPADTIAAIQDSRKLGLEVEIKKVDFQLIFDRMRNFIRNQQEEIRQSLRNIRNLEYFEAQTRFIRDLTLEVNGQAITAKKIFIMAGSRPLIPPIKGIHEIEYLTSETLLKLTHKPESVLIVGGGNIGVEYGHMLAALGSRVTIVEMADRLVEGEEPEIAELLKKKMEQRMEVLLNVQVLEFGKHNNRYSARIRNSETGVEGEIFSEAVMLAAGRKSNADLLGLDNSGVEVDKRGFIRVDDYLETTRKNIYAAGDIIGRYMLTHVANREAVQVWHNATHGPPEAMDYSAVPHAVFTHPQIASVGLTEVEARKHYHVLIGVARYSEVAKGIAMMEEDGFAKAIVDKDTERILGFHIIGPEASTLIQEVTNAMATRGGVKVLNMGMHTHPAMPELISSTLYNLKEPEAVEIKTKSAGATVLPA